MREIRIKLWDINTEDTAGKVSPISITYYIFEEALKEAGVEGFKAVARKQFEKILDKWGKENE